MSHSIARSTPQASPPLDIAATLETPSQAQEDSRTSVSDGKRNREVWVPSDGDGEYNAEVIEKLLTKDGRPKRGYGHSSWKLYMGHVQPSTNCNAKPEDFPKYVYLDDRAAWDVFHFRQFNAAELKRFWPFDFSSAGRFPAQRLHRGRPSYKAGSFTGFASIKIRGKDYFFHGSLPSPVDTTKPARSSTHEPTTNLTSIDSDSPEHMQQRIPVTPKIEVSSPSSTLKLSCASHLHPGHRQIKQDSMVLDDAGTQNIVQQGASHNCTSSSDTSDEKKATELLGKDQNRPITIEPITVEKDTAGNDYPFKRSTTSPLASALNCDGGSSNKSKRQRTALVPYTVPQDTLKADNEALKEQLAMAKQTVARLNRHLGKKNEEMNAFRSLARALFLSKVDQQDDLARIHTGVKGLCQELNAMQERVKLPLKPMEELHSRCEQTVAEQEKIFVQKGMKEAWDDFVGEALSE